MELQAQAKRVEVPAAYGLQVASCVKEAPFDAIARLKVLPSLGVAVLEVPTALRQASTGVGTFILAAAATFP